VYVNGVFPAQWLSKALDDGSILTPSVADAALQPASLDLRLGDRAYRLRCSFLPDADTVETKLDRYGMESLDLRDGAILERNRPYLIPLVEGLALPAGVRARTNPKSSIGRLDVFTRVITDHSHRFDEIVEGYAGRMWLEVVSRSFTIKVRSGQSLNQLRLVAGDARVVDAEILEVHRAEPVLLRDDRPVAPSDVSLSDGLFLSLDLRREPFVGYRARKNSRLLDLTSPELLEADDFWEPVPSERGDRLVLEPEEFYLLISAEGVRIPPGFAAEMTAYDPTSGELRTHYAGFFDPGFGYEPEDPSHSSRAVLEVRAHDVPFMIEHELKVCRLRFERMLEPPSILYGAGIGSSYQGQVAMLSKFFRR